jgi:hypothetical protein
MTTNFVDLDDQSAGGSTEALNDQASTPKSNVERFTQINGITRTSCQHVCCYEGTGMVCNSAHSGDSSPSADGSTSSGSSNRTRVIPAPFYFPSGYNSGPDQSMFVFKSDKL